MKSSVTPVDWLLLALLVVAWGSSFAMTKLAVGSLDPNWIMALRISVAAVVLTPFALLTGHNFSLSALTWVKFAWLALTGYVVPFFLITWGMQYVSSGIAGLLMGSIPLMMVVAAHVFLANEKLTPPKTIGFLFGFLGIVILVLPKASFGDFLASKALIGELAILLGCFCYVAHSISAKKMGFFDPIMQTAAICCIGAVFGVVLASLQANLSLAQVTAAPVLAVVGLGVIPTALASVIMYRLIERAGPSFVSTSNYLVPVYAVFLGAALFGEEIGWNVALALALVLAGIAISRRRTLRFN
jgi:drug/metabolite transporter (DMT)-like permease